MEWTSLLTYFSKSQQRRDSGHGDVAETRGCSWDHIALWKPHRTHLGLEAESELRTTARHAALAFFDQDRGERRLRAQVV